MTRHLAGGRKALLWVKNNSDFWRFCYLNIPCLRMNITLIFMSSSSEEFRNKYENTKTDVSVGFRRPYLCPCKRVSMGWWLLRLSAKILALLRLSVNFFQLRLTKKLKINFFCFKKLNIN